MIYIQTPNGLTQISSQLSKEKIIAALGYTPADQASFYEDESGSLVIADEKGFIIARIDETGLKTTTVSANAIKLNDVDLALKLQELENRNVDLSNYYNKTEVDDKLKNVSIDTSNLATQAALATHSDNNNIHVNIDDKNRWDAKSDFSGNYSDLAGAPNITTDQQDNEFIISDTNGNVILRVNSNGLNVADLYINGVKLTNNASWKFTVNDKEYEVTPETQRWSDWINANPGKGLVMSGETIYYDYVTDQWLIDVKSSDFIIPGHKYTYNTDY